MKLVRIFSLTTLLAWACQTSDPSAVQASLSFHPTLSEYQLFEGEIADLKPTKDVYPYELNSALFTDYAHKARFFKLPPNTKMEFQGDGLPKFPEGTILIKNFFYQEDERALSPIRRLVETRLLVKDKSKWKVATYIWNDEQTEAFHEILGAKKEVSWINKEGISKTINYIIPDNNDCKSCHQKRGKDYTNRSQSKKFESCE